MSDHGTGHGDHEKKEVSFGTTLKRILIGVALLFVVIVLFSIVFKSCYKNQSKNDDARGHSKKESPVANQFSKTIDVSFGTSYGDPVYLPGGYDFSFIQKTGGEYCVKNSQDEVCGVGDISGKIPGGEHNTKGLWFKGEKEGSLEILLVKNNNL